MAALANRPPGRCQSSKRPPPTRGLIYKVPLEIIFKIFQLVAPPRTRDDMYRLLKLTHVCRLWRVALINKPQAWATIFATRKDRRSFVETCLERSASVPLEVTVDVVSWARRNPTCTCRRDRRSRLIPNEANPCERHFVFEPLAEAEHSGRINTLKIQFYEGPLTFRDGIALGGCRFFTSFPLQLMNLEWTDAGSPYAVHLFPSLPFPLTLRSLSFDGAWHDQFPTVNNLTSLTFLHREEHINAETFRTFIHNNKSLEALSLKYLRVEGNQDGPPVDLLNLKSLTVNNLPDNFSTIVRIPAFQRLSSSLIVFTEIADAEFSLFASGEGIALTIHSGLTGIVEMWQQLTGYTRPRIYRVRLENDAGDSDNYMSDWEETAITLIADAHTLEIGDGFMLRWYRNFSRDLKELGPHLRTICFEVPEEAEPLRESGEYWAWGGELLDAIERLVVGRFELGRQLSSVRRMVVSKNEWTNRQQRFVWRCFYNDRGLDRYIQHE